MHRKIKKLKVSADLQETFRFHWQWGRNREGAENFKDTADYQYIKYMNLVLCRDLTSPKNSRTEDSGNQAPLPRESSEICLNNKELLFRWLEVCSL